MKFLIKNLIIWIVLFTGIHTCIAQPGSALNFDGVNDFVLIPNSSLLNVSKVTIETWVKWNSSSTTINFICSKNYEQLEIHTGGGAGNNGIRFIPASGVYLDGPANILPTNVWTHIAYVYDPSIALAKLYVNGVEKTLTNHGSNPLTTPIGNSVADFNLGRRSTNNYFFYGEEDEFRIWDHVLTQCEIQNHMNCELSLPQNGLIAYYNFNQGIAGNTNTGINILPDIGPNNLNGTLNNFALAGGTSNWITPGGVINGTSCNNPAASIVLTNGSNPSCAGSSLSFQVTTFNIANPTYQWTKNSANISGQTNSTYTTSSWVDKDTIRCLVFNNCMDLTTSNAIVMSINAGTTPKVYISSNTYLGLCPGDTAVFAATTIRGGTSPLFQWQRNGIDIPGAVDSFFISNSLIDNDSIRCKIISNSNAPCLTTLADSSNVEIIKIAPTYRFTGNGNWSDSSNWSNNKMAPLRVSPCSQVIIDPAPGGECDLDYSLLVSPGGTFQVEPGKKLVIKGNLVIADTSAVNYSISLDSSHMGGNLPMSAAAIQAIPLVEESDLSSLTVLSPTDLQGNHIIEMPPIGTQFGNGCVGWAVGYATLGFINKSLENNIYPGGTADYSSDDKLTSPSFIYNQINGGVDQGATIDEALELVKNKGCCKWADMPNVSINNLFPPTPQAMNNALVYKNIGYRYKRFPTNDINELKQALSGDHPLPFGCEVDASFVNWSRALNQNVIQLPDGRRVWMNYGSGPRLHHAMVLCGYDDAIHAFKVMNSSGINLTHADGHVEEVGNEGFFWIDYDFFKMLATLKFGFPSAVFIPTVYLVEVERPAVTITTKPASSVSGTGASSGYTILSNDGSIYENGICFSRNINPTTAWGNNDSTVISTNGDAAMTGLIQDATYHVRAYAKTSRGIIYGNEVSFIAQLQTALTTSQVNSITLNSAMSGGNITNDGGSPITSRGVCWSLLPGPTILDNKTLSGSGSGTFYSSMTNLDASTTYYVRAFATNNLGTVYGNELSFITLDSSFTDVRDGHTYTFRHIGSQVWMTQNLNYSAGVSWCSNGQPTPNLCGSGGLFYDWNTASSVAAPAGWHLPSDADWDGLIQFLGGNSVAGGKMKAVNVVFWNSPNTGATNSSGFSGLAWGERNSSTGTNVGFGQAAMFWSSTPYNTNYANFKQLYYSTAAIGGSAGNKLDGYNVRCVRDQ